jgi:hypothetical protein
MRWGLILVTLTAIAAIAWSHIAILPFPPMPKGVPIDRIANGRILPQVGLTGPLPEWIPLPEKGLVLGAGLYPPQPPYGAAASMMLKLSESQSTFVGSYRRRLEQAGFSWRHLPTPFNLIVDRPDDQFEADGKNGTHVVFIVLRAKEYAQLTFWDAPVPRMPGGL